MRYTVAMSEHTAHLWEPDVDWVVCNGFELYTEHLPATDGQATLVFLHGGPGHNSATFGRLFGERLAEMGVGVLLYDMRGSGRSEALPEDTETLDLDGFLHDLEALQAHFELEKIVPLGHGFGALVAFEYARLFPERVERVIAVNPWMHMPTLAREMLRLACEITGEEFIDLKAEVLQNTPEGQYPAVGEARVRAAFELMSPTQLFAAMHFKSHQDRMQFEFAEAENQLVASGQVTEALVQQGLWEFEYPAILMENPLRCAVAVIVGERDRSSYPEQSDWAIDFTDARNWILPESGHYPWLDSEDEFAEALEEALEL